MTILVNIGEAKTRLSELIAAAVRGEEVFVAKAGVTQVRLVPTAELSSAEIARRSEQRRSAFGMFRHLVDGHEIDVARIKREDAELQESYRRKFGDPA